MAGYDEAFTPGGGVREPYAAALAALDAQGPGLEDTGIAIGGGAAARPLPVDPIPRIFTAREWAPLAAGLEQRARLLEALMRLEQPPRSHYHEPGLPLDGPPLAVVGFDVARRPDGGFALLEENVLTPGHVALPAAREAARLWERSAPLGVAAPLREALRDALGEDAAILADDPPSWETRWLGRFLGVPVVGLDEARGRLPRTVWYRTAEDRLRDDAGALTPLGELLLEPLLERRVRVLNRPGAGVVEDKRLLIDAPRTLRAVLGEEPLLPVLPTVPATAPVDPRAQVYKPAHGAGGRGVVVRPEAPVGDDGWVAQRYVPLSVHPTVTADGLVPRPVDLRAFAIRGREGWRVLPGGVSRFPTDPYAPVVNTSAGGGIKDVWVLPRPPRAAPPGGRRGGRR